MTSKEKKKWAPERQQIIKKRCIIPRKEETQKESRLSDNKEELIVLKRVHLCSYCHQNVDGDRNKTEGNKFNAA